MFTVHEPMLAVRELMFIALEHKFTAREHKFKLGINLSLALATKDIKGIQGKGTHLILSWEAIDVT